MPLALQAFLVAFGVVFIAELPDKTMFATIVLSTRYRRPVAVVAGVTLAMIFHSVLAVAVGEGLRHLPRLPTQLAVAAVFLVGGILMLMGGDEETDIDTAPVHSAWGVVGRSALIIGIAEFGDFTQLATRPGKRAANSSRVIARVVRTPFRTSTSVASQPAAFASCQNASLSQ